MLKLIQNEWMKLWRKKSTWVMLILLTIFVIGFGGLDKWLSTKDANEEVSWQEVQENTRADLQMNLDSGELSAESEENVRNELQIIEYRLDNNVAPLEENSAQQYILTSYSFLSIISMFAIVVAAGIVSSEFSTGTIKMLLTRPVKRWKILTSKLATVILFGIFMSAITLALSVITGFVFFGWDDGSYLQVASGKVVEASIWSYSLYMYLLSFSDILMTALLAFMLGAVFRSSSLAVGLTLFLSLAGGVIVLFLSKYEIVKYLVITHSDLTQYETGDIYVEGITMSFSLAVLAVYIVVFTIISFLSFVKRDVTA